MLQNFQIALLEDMDMRGRVQGKRHGRKFTQELPTHLNHMRLFEAAPIIGGHPPLPMSVPDSTMKNKTTRRGDMIRHEES